MHGLIVRVSVLLTAVSCLAVSSSPAADAPKLRVATFQCDVTPPVGGHPLIWLTPLETVETPLLAKGIVLDDGRQRYVICSVDWCGLCNSSYDLFRGKLAAGAGVDVSHVAVQCVHQHTAPYTDGDAQRLLDKEENPPEYCDFKFLEEVTDRLAAAVRSSLEKLQPFDSVGLGEAKVDRVASSRRVPIEGGKVRVRWSSCKDPELRAMTEGYIDPMLKTVTFAQGDKPLVRMHYYATHPQSFYGDPRASYDVPGFARERLQEKENVFQIYFNGCGGDVTMGKYNDASPGARDELTDRLYAGMETSVSSTRFVPAGRLVWRTAPLLLEPKDKSPPKMADVKASPMTRVHTAVQVSFAQRIERPIELTSLRIDDLYILHLPGECMVEFQLFAQRSMPGKFVATAAYGDLCPGYICTEKAFPEGGYEPSASRGSPQSEKVLKAAIRRLLGIESDSEGK